MKIIQSIIILIALNIQLNTCSDVTTDRIRLCIINCGQCKAVYGEFFLGQQCAEHCLINRHKLNSGELQVPDCNSPISIMPYIKKVVDDNRLEVI